MGVQFRHYFAELLPPIQRRDHFPWHASCTLGAATLKRDREVVLKIVSLEDRMLIRMFTLNILGDVIEDIKDSYQPIACCRCSALKSSEKMFREQAVSATLHDDRVFSLA